MIGNFSFCVRFVSGIKILFKRYENYNFRRQKRYRKKIRRENNYIPQLAQLSNFHLNHPSIKLIENESWLTDSPNLRYRYLTENSRLPHKIKKSRLPSQIIREEMPKKIEYSIKFKYDIKLSGQSQVISVWPHFQDHTFSSSSCNQPLAVHCVQPLLILTVIYTRFYI